MVQDFAKSMTPPQPQSAPASVVGGSLRTAVVVLLLLGLVIAAFLGGYQLGQRHGVDLQKAEAQRALQQRFDQQQQEISRLQAELVTQAKQSAAEAKPKNTTEIGELTFYNDLPNAKVLPDEAGMDGTRQVSHSLERGVADIIAQSRHGAEAGVPLRIQIGSFARKAEAESLKQQVVRLGLICTIHAAKLSGDRQRLRVMVGPYANMKQALAAKKQLKQKLHVEGLIVRGG
ncbi:MAG: SPOR domain-containing protein [Mariprofundales bacterium]